MHKVQATPLILGGHSFFSGLGNEAVPDEGLQIELVRACLEQGIRAFDTTHQPERIALGRALAALGRRAEAEVFAWNFMEVLDGEEKLDRPVAFEPHHLDQLLSELQTSFIDCLVVHELDQGTPAVHKSQEEVALNWKQQGYVGRIGIWAPDADAQDKYGVESIYDFMVRPFNVWNADKAAPAFAASKALGWETIGCSPFVRGWELDKLVKRALDLHGGEVPAMRERLADHLLRFSLFAPNVDRLITAIRRLDWVAPNIESAKRGPLDSSERTWLAKLR